MKKIYLLLLFSLFFVPVSSLMAADPTLEDFTVFTPINTTYTFTQADFEDAYNDLDGDAITEIQILNIPVASRGEVQFNGSTVTFASLPRTISIADINAGRLTFVPATGFEGSANIRWDANNAVDSYPNDPDYVIIRIGDYLDGCTVDNPPRVKDIEMVKKRDFTSTGTNPYITPFVGDFNGDGETDVLSGGDSNFRILDPKQTTTAAATLVNFPLAANRENNTNASTVAIADVFTYDDASNTVTSNTPDGKAEIFYYAENDRLLCLTVTFDGTNTGIEQVWDIEVDGTGATQRTAVVVYDINADGHAEVIAHAKAYDAEDGDYILDLGGVCSPVQQRGYAYDGAVPEIWSHVTVYDALPNPGNEVFIGHCVVSATITNYNGTAGNTASEVRNSGKFEADGSETLEDGVVSLADMDLDGDVDAVVSSQGYVYVWDIQNATEFLSTGGTGAMEGVYDLPETGANSRRSSFASIGDFDNDGYPEFVVVSQENLSVFEDIVNSPNITPLWEVGTTDESGSTSVSTYDFFGTGEVAFAYRDETQIRVFNGATSDVLYQEGGCNSNTGTEVPVIADVDDDGETEIVVSCDGNISIYRSDNIPWVVSRSVWNQVNYNVVNVNDDLSLPSLVDGNHTNTQLNNFQSQEKTTALGGTGIDATDLSIVLTDFSTNLNLGACPSITATFSVTNNDSDPFNSNVPISFFNGDPTIAGSSTFLNTENVSVNVAANSSATYTVSIDLPPSGTAELFTVINHPGTYGSVTDPSVTDAITFPFTTIGECDYTNNLYGPLSFSACNAAPFAGSVSVSTCAGENYVFSNTDFENAFSDGNAGDALSQIQVLSLPTSGTLYDGTVSAGNEVAINDIFTTAELTAGDLIFVPSTGTTTTTFLYQNRDDAGANALSSNNSGTVAITVDPLPTVSATTSNASICPGESATLTASGSATSYTWNPGSLSGATVSVSPTSNETYTVTGTDGNGCSATATVDVTVNPLPTATISTTTSICAGAILNLDEIGGDATSWSWSVSGAASLNDPSLQAPEATGVTDGDVFTVEVTDGSGCSATATVAVTVNPLPNAAISPSNTTFTPGSSVTLTASGGGTYLWNTGANTAQITVTPTVTTTYSVTVTSVSGCTAVATAQVVGATPTISSITAPAITCQNNDATILVEGLLGSTTSTLTYDLGAPNAATGITVTVVANASGTGNFVISGANLSNTGSTTVTVTEVATGSASTSVSVSATLNISASSTCFSCEPLFYQVIAGELRPYEPLTGSYGAGITNEPEYNALGFNIQDRLMYAMDRLSAGSFGPRDLMRILADGTLQNLGNVAGSGNVIAADVGPNDDFWAVDPANTTQLFRIPNISTLPVNAAATVTPETGFAWTGSISTPGSIADIVIIGEVAYGLDRNTNGAGETQMYRWNLNTLARSEVTVSGFTPNLPEGFGAGFTDINGNMYFANNVGELYTIQDFTTASPVAIYLGNTEPTNSNDGTSCPLALSPIDNDEDSILDPLDIDADNDGITNVDESGGDDPFADADNDGVFAYLDADDLSASVTSTALNPAFDNDGDGVPNFFDLDSDNDGIYDVVEAGHSASDTNNDGVIDGADTGSGTNGLFDPLETADTPTTTLTYTVADSDTDSNINALEADSDADGCPDVAEAGFTANSSTPTILNTSASPTVDSDGVVVGASDGYTDPGTNYTNSATNGIAVAASDNTPICVGEALTLSSTATLTTISGTTTFGWTGPNAYSSTSASPTVVSAVSLTEAGTYTVTVTVQGCSASASTVAVVDPSPTVSATTSASAICAGESTTLTASGSATSYTWSPGGATGTTFVVSPTVNTTYTVTGTDGNGCSATATVDVTVNPAPTLTSVSATDVCQSTSLTVNLGGMPTSGTYEITYSVSGTNTITNATATVTPNGSGDGSFTISGAALPNTGTHTIEITNIENTTTNCAAALTGISDTFEVLNQVQSSDIIISH